MLRAQTLSVRNREYVLAARASGERAWRIVFVEILPNELPIIVSKFIFAMIFAILTQAGSRVHRARRSDAADLGEHAQLRLERRGAVGRGLVVVHPARPVHRAARHGAGADQLQPGRGSQPAAAGLPRSAGPAGRAAPGARHERRGSWSCGPSTSASSTPARRPTRAVRDVTLELRRGEVLGIAGESGCGKSTLAYALTRMLQAAGPP